MTRRPILVSILILAGLSFSVAVQAQWLTRADETSTPHRVPQMHKQDSEEGTSVNGEDDDRGVGDAFKFWQQQRTFGLGYIPDHAFQNAVAKRNAMLTSFHSGKGATVQSTPPAWSLVGPDNIGGRINTIAINQHNPSTVYVGAANGGVWRTRDAGATWTPLTDQLQSVSMGSLAIDPNDTNVVFAGTGELPATTDSYAGYGLLRSSDGGNTWSDVGPNSVAAYSRVIVNPTNSNIVYAAAGRAGGGILRSSDNGLTWNWLGGGLPQSVSVTDLALSMNGSTAVLYAGVVGRGVFRSTDGGDSWTELFPFTEQFINAGLDSSSDMVRIALDVDPTNWKNVVALDVSSVIGQDDFGGLSVSTDGGDNWTDAATQFDPNTGFEGSPLEEPNGAAAPQGWYDVYVRVDPSNFQHMFFGGVGLSSTNDGGNTWTDPNYNLFHVDNHALEFAPSDPKQIYAGSDGGVFYSNDEGSTFSSSTFLLPITQFYGIGIDQTQPNLTYGGTQDNGSLSSESGTSFNQFYGGDGTFTQVDPKFPNDIYFETPQTYPLASINGSVREWGGIRAYDSAVWLNPFAADSVNDIIYWGSQRLVYTKNQGSSSTSCNQVFGSASASTTISAIDAFGDGKTVLVGTGGGLVYLTTNNGTSFTNISSNLPSRWVTWVKFSPSSASTFYATLSGFGTGHVFETTNSGKSWSDISLTLPDIPVDCLLMDPDNSNVLYIGTDVGVFLSPNNGGEWVPYGTGLPNTAVPFMEVHNSDRMLRAGTHGRSIWQIALSDDMIGIVKPAQRTVWTIGDTASIQWHGFNTPVTLDLSLDGGETWQNVAQNAGDTVYPITAVGYAPSENAQVRVSDGTNTLVSALFTIAQQKAGNVANVVGEYTYYLYDIAYDKDDNVLWATNFSPSEFHIYKIDPDLGTVLDSLLIPISTVGNRAGFTGIKYDPVSKDLFIQEVKGTGDGDWSSEIYEVTTSGLVVGNNISTPSLYGTGIYVKGDTVLSADRMAPGPINLGVLGGNGIDFTTLNAWSGLSDTRSASYGPRGLTYDPKLGEYLLAYTDFQGTGSGATLNGSYLLFLDTVNADEDSALTIQVGEDVTNVRGMEWDPRNGGNTAWMTVLTSSGGSQLVKIALADGPVSIGPVAQLTATPSPINFGNVDTGQTSTMTIELHNTGTVPDTITSIVVNPGGTAFSLSGTSFAKILLPGDSMSVQVIFAPHTPDGASAELVVTYDGSQSEFPLTGFATIDGASVAAEDAPGWSLALSPNPAGDYVDLTLEAANTDALDVHIYDVTGREVHSDALGTVAPGEHEIELSTEELASGMYFVRVMGTEGQVAAARLAIAR